MALMVSLYNQGRSEMPLTKFQEQIVIYADDRTNFGQEALMLFEDSRESIVKIPTAGGLPFAVRGRSRYVGIEEIKMLAEELREKG
jgi:hypothetical protein